MMKFGFLYRREQRKRFVVEAVSQEEAEKIANEIVRTLPDDFDESDDPGELDIEDIDGEPTS